MIWGGELVLRDGTAVGQVTSGAWGETVGGCVGLAYIRHPDGRVLTPDVVRAGEYQVNVGGQLHPATVDLRPRSTRPATASRAAIPRPPHRPKVHRTERAPVPASPLSTVRLLVALSETGI